MALLSLNMIQIYLVNRGISLDLSQLKFQAEMMQTRPLREGQIPEGYQDPHIVEFLNKLFESNDVLSSSPSASGSTASVTSEESSTS